MRALIRKDRMLLAVVTAVVIATHFSALVASQARPVWVYPSNDAALVASMLLALFASVLGLWTSVRDDLFRTRDYLAHRPVSPETRFIALHGACCAVIVAWVVVPLVVFLGLSYVVKGWTAMFEPGRLWVYIGVEIGAALPAYACGALAGVIAPRLVASGVVTVAIVVAGCAVGALLLPVPLAIGFALRVLLGGAALAALLLTAAYLADREPRDADRPWSAARLFVTAPIVVVVGAISVSATALGIGEGGREVLHEIYPEVFERADGSLGLLRFEYRDGDDRPIEVGADHRPVREVSRKRGERIRTEQPRAAFSDSWWSAEFPVYPAFSGNYPYGSGCGRAQCLLARDQRNVLELRFVGEGSSRRINRADGVQFSRETQIVGRWNDPPAFLLGDPGDGTLWAYRAAEGKAMFERVPLPGDDRFVTVMPVVGRRGLLSYNPPEDPADVAVRGERGFYTHAGTAMVPVPEAARADLEKRWRERRLAEMVLLDKDPLSFTIEARPVDGRPAFRHHYAPRTGWERAAAGLMYLSSLIRPPVAQAVAASLPPTRKFGNRPALDALIAGGKRPGLLLAVLFSALVFAALTYRRLHRAGAPARDRLVWTASALLTGWIGWGLARLLAPDRAFRGVPVPAESTAAPPLLLESA